MKLLLGVFEEIYGLFVDDGALAVLSLLLVAAVAIAVKLVGLPAQWGGFGLAAGCLVILALSVHRGAKR